MPVDRSLLPPLPGKPDWYVENAPTAVDLTPRAPLPMSVHQVEQAVPAFLPQTSPLAAPSFPTLDTQPDHGGKGLRKIKALLHK